MGAYIPQVSTDRLRLVAYRQGDVDALAAILGEPDVSKNITANGSTPERCLESARQRINWHNSSWSDRGYGVWAVRAGAGLDGVVPARNRPDFQSLETAELAGRLLKTFKTGLSEPPLEWHHRDRHA